jgi:hypothetical protein
MGDVVQQGVYHQRFGAAPVGSTFAGVPLIDLAELFPPEEWSADGESRVFDDEYSSFHDVDTSAEVDAAFRSQRRIALTYFVVFVLVLVGVAVATVTSGWATADGLVGGFSPSFLMTAVGLYLFFVLLGAAAAGLANGVDDRMLGASSLPRSQARSSAGDGQSGLGLDE